MPSASEIADRSQKALARLRSGIAESRKNASGVAAEGGYELLGHTVLAAASASAGYFGQDKLKPWGIELRVVPGLIGQIGGLLAMLFGYKMAGRLAVVIGRGAIGSWLGERAFVAGAKMREVPDRAQRQQLPDNWQTRIGADVPFGAQTGSKDVVLTRTTRF
jgi:hypothetical protein